MRTSSWTSSRQAKNGEQCNGDLYMLTIQPVLLVKCSQATRGAVAGRVSTARHLPKWGVYQETLERLFGHLRSAYYPPVTCLCNWCVDATIHTSLLITPRGLLTDIQCISASNLRSTAVTLCGHYCPAFLTLPNKSQPCAHVLLCKYCSDVACFTCMPTHRIMWQTCHWNYSCKLPAQFMTVHWVTQQHAAPVL